MDDKYWAFNHLLTRDKHKRNSSHTDERQGENIGRELSDELLSVMYVSLTLSCVYVCVFITKTFGDVPFWS